MLEGECALGCGVGNRVEVYMFVDRTSGVQPVLASNVKSVLPASNDVG